VTDTRSWWPDGYGDDPAFQLRRIVYGTITGGDYVRGSSVLALPHTALRYPTTTPGAAEALDRAILHVRVKNHYVRQEALLDDNQVVQRYFNWPVGDIEITWGWPSTIEDTWQQVSLVRSAFGRPSTVNDGQTVFLATRAAFTDKDGNLTTPLLITDTNLPTGRWYHYGLFFKVSQTEWIQGMLDSTLLPRDFHHTDHLWDNIPPYYRWVDDNGLMGSGYLRQFLSVFGFELDTAREYIEAWQHLYDTDWSPIRLLRKLGDNIGYPYEQGVGDIRYRSLFTRVGHLYETRGTQECLEEVVSLLSKYMCSLTGGSNVMLLPDDSDFSSSGGNWGVVRDATDAPGSGYLTKDKVTIAPADPTWMSPPPGIGRGVLSIYTRAADATGDIGIACGDSYVPLSPEAIALVPYDWKEITPITGGIPVDPLMSYGFSIWIQSQLLPTAVQLALLFFDGDANLTSTTTAPLTSLSTVNTWQEFSIGTVVAPPAGAVYVCPYILFDTRSTSGAYPVTSPAIFLAGAMVYATPSVGEAIGPPPNRYLTISDPSEPLGQGLTFKGTLTGAATALPTTHATWDAWVLSPAPVPTAAPQFLGVTPARAAAVNDAIYWNGTAWVNAGPLPNSWLPFLLGAPT
jgi:phage tail-like protein